MKIRPVATELFHADGLMGRHDVIFAFRNIAFTMTERADQLHHDNAPAHSTVLVHGFFFWGGGGGKASHHPGLSASLQPRFVSLQLLAFLKAKIAVERKEICERDGHKIRKFSQRRLTADWLAPRESDYSRMHSKVSSDWLPSYIKATRPLLEIFKMAGYSPNSPRTHYAKTHRHATHLVAKCTGLKQVRLEIFALIIRHANQIHASCII